jgi:hypothetical protein
MTTMTYQQWKAAATATLAERHRISAGAIPPREWRQYFILGLSIADAVERAEAYYNNRVRSAADRQRNRAEST